MWTWASTHARYLTGRRIPHRLKKQGPERVPMPDISLDAEFLANFRLMILLCFVWNKMERKELFLKFLIRWAKIFNLSLSVEQLLSALGPLSARFSEDWTASRRAWAFLNDLARHHWEKFSWGWTWSLFLLENLSLGSLLPFKSWVSS